MSYLCITIDTKMKKTLSKYLLFIILLSSCAQGTRFSSTYSFPDETWQRFDNPVLNFNIDAPGVYYDMFLELEYDAFQPPSDFLVTVLMYTPSGEMRARDIQIKMVSPGDESDKPGIFTAVLRREFAFSDKGLCKFEIESRSSKVTTNGVKNISIILEKSQ